MAEERLELGEDLRPSNAFLALVDSFKPLQSLEQIKLANEFLVWLGEWRLANEDMTPRFCQIPEEFMSKVIVWITVQVQNKSLEGGRVADLLRSLISPGHWPSPQLCPSLDHLASVVQFKSATFTRVQGWKALASGLRQDPSVEPPAASYLAAIFRKDEHVDVSDAMEVEGKQTLPAVLLAPVFPRLTKEVLSYSVRSVDVDMKPPEDFPEEDEDLFDDDGRIPALTTALTDQPLHQPEESSTDNAVSEELLDLKAKLDAISGVTASQASQASQPILQLTSTDMLPLAEAPNVLEACKVLELDSLRGEGLRQVAEALMPLDLSISASREIFYELLVKHLLGLKVVNKDTSRILNNFAAKNPTALIESILAPTICNEYFGTTQIKMILGLVAKQFSPERVSALFRSVVAYSSATKLWNQSFGGFVIDLLNTPKFAPPSPDTIDTALAKFLQQVSLAKGVATDSKTGGGAPVRLLTAFFRKFRGELTTASRAESLQKLASLLNDKSFDALIASSRSAAK